MKAALTFLLPAVLLCAYPLAIVASANIQSVPLDGYIVSRAVLVAIGAVVIVVWLLKWLQPDLPGRALWAGWVLLLFILYESFVRLGVILGFTIDAENSALALLYVAATLTVATIVTRPWRVRPRNPWPLTFFAAALLAITLYPVAAWGISHPTHVWRPSAEALIGSALTSPQQPRSAPTRDIYYLVLDGLGRPDVLEDLYDLKLAPFVSLLRGRGFHVAERAHSNYAQTFLSLASTLNMNYLDAVAGPMRNSTDRRPLAYLIQSNALMQAARRAGYRVVGIGSDYMATERWDAADDCVCRRFGLDEFEQSALAKTPLAGLPLNRWATDAHRRKIRQAFEALGSPVSGQGPAFVFAHIVAPHPPFVFRADGTARPSPPRWRFSFGDGDHFLGSRPDYLEGYRDQTAFVTRQLTRLVEGLLSRPGPPPVIIIHGDHGPGSFLRWDDPKRTDVRERMAIFAAYYFPDADPALSQDLSPVNGARALANRYLGLNLPLLQDKAFVSTWMRPYDFIPVRTGELE